MSFTGRERQRTTAPSVRRTEILSRVFITAGGLATIGAVALICIFLVWVTMPLFLGGEVTYESAVDAASGEAPLIRVGQDEHRLLTWTLRADGELVLSARGSGEELRRERLFEDGKVPTAWAFAPSSDDVAFGFADGTVVVGKIGFRTDFLEPPRFTVPEQLADMKRGEQRVHERGIVKKTVKHQLRWSTLTIALEDGYKAADAEILALDRTNTSSGTAALVFSADDALLLVRTEMRENFMTGEMDRKVKKTPLPYVPSDAHGRPDFVKIDSEAILAYVGWESGYVQRFAVTMRDLDGPAETFDILAGEGGKVRTVRWHNGQTTILAGDDQGNVHAWFPTRPEGPVTPDATQMVRGHRLEIGDGTVTAIATSKRTRLMAAGLDSGFVRLINVTTEKELDSYEIREDAAVAALSIAPKEDGLLSWGANQRESHRLEAGHHEVSFGSLFGKVWYEGASAPGAVYQSTGGGDQFEPKLNLRPLIFGTIKVTLYTILLSAPIAFLAAIFTSEFLDPRMRSGVKSTIEMMASLPSVVLGFLAAFVLAPFVGRVLPTTMGALLGVPLVLLLGARLWQLLPAHLTLRWSRMPRLLTIVMALPLGILVAQGIGGIIENVFFGGDMMAWLSANDPESEAGANIAGGWHFLLWPCMLFVLAYVMASVLGSWQRSITLSMTRMQCALYDLTRFAVWVFGAYVLAGLVAELLAKAGFDPRGPLQSSTESSVLGPYSPTNAIIVAFVMGFAVIPIIYTLAEDALSSVPRALREGSLGAGATPWQTATRIVIPTAMSGLFGALMVGLGRAVGETMIVLMAMGSTPITDWNMFNGGLPLSANIATEMPEAAQHSTHYRVLFLAALVLFAMTFLINLAAEIVRRISRRRFADL